MKSGSIRLCAYAGLTAMTLMFIAMWPFWHILPPPSPNMPLEQMADHFRLRPTSIITGGVLMMLGASLYFLFFGGLVACLKKMEGPVAPLTTAVALIVPFGFFPLFAMAVFFIESVFRPGLSSETIRVLADLGIFMLVIPGLPGLIQFVTTGFIILGDINPQPIFPRWIGYFNIWVGILSIPGCLVAYFKTGPFAWNGILAFWVPAVIFGILMNVTAFAMINAEKRGALNG